MNLLVSVGLLQLSLLGVSVLDILAWKLRI